MTPSRDVLPKDTIRKWVNGEIYQLHELLPELRAALDYFDHGAGSVHIAAEREPSAADKRLLGVLIRQAWARMRGADA